MVPGAGLAWEQRPAIGDPDDFYHLSLGSGFSIGQDPGQIIIDFAYILGSQGFQMPVTAVPEVSLDHDPGLTVHQRLGP